MPNLTPATLAPTPASARRPVGLTETAKDVATQCVASFGDFSQAGLAALAQLTCSAADTAFSAVGTIGDVLHRHGDGLESAGQHALGMACVATVGTTFAWIGPLAARETFLLGLSVRETWADTTLLGPRNRETAAACVVAGAIGAAVVGSRLTSFGQAGAQAIGARVGAWHDAQPALGADDQVVTVAFIS